MRGGSDDDAEEEQRDLVSITIHGETHEIERGQCAIEVFRKFGALQNHRLLFNGEPFSLFTSIVRNGSYALEVGSGSTNLPFEISEFPEVGADLAIFWQDRECVLHLCALSVQQYPTVREIRDAFLKLAIPQLPQWGGRSIDMVIGPDWALADEGQLTSQLHSRDQYLVAVPRHELSCALREQLLCTPVAPASSGAHAASAPQPPTQPRVVVAPPAQPPQAAEAEMVKKLKRELESAEICIAMQREQLAAARVELASAQEDARRLTGEYTELQHLSADASAFLAP
ncbi:hypothetical protein PAPYR_3815 [Paratrimastix pyriformis]|uniref:Uncharacterized protein n=1 Tax=Paratrimastix pyriformis TaxID=342808 RepID=A0ABQ8ULL7_9EUKA|nr:hypothetical protein PAPYR_3815 [Paratrimastix pyriformis]